MAGTVSEESVVGRSLEGISVGQQQRCQASSEALAEWRSSEQLENGTPSTSPPYWDTDDDDDCGSKPSELYGKFTWKIDKFSQNNKRELRSKEFEVGGYKWYILIYPQGCDVCNHISLFLCVANHDKLLPGWSHFAQFTIAVVNKDPKKSKYSDTLHRFWKKEHDWGWKKFIELSKVSDGFTDADTLIIKAQVQVIRERADHPFRCLDCQYRRELVRVYLTNVEQICRRFVEERRGKLGKMIEDKARWSSFCAFWLEIDQNARRRMSRERTDSVLKVVVKHFFIEKEVTSTLVMDSLHSGLKALQGQTKSKKGRGKYIDAEELPVNIVRIENDTFILVDDVLLLLDRAAMEPLPPKDEKGPQNGTKDGGSGEDFTKDSIERDERRLTELGRRTIEIFVLAHIFSKIEVAYQEAVALKRQEELIREEEAAWMAESELKSKRAAAEKDKKSKKKQGKQKRNNRKGKDKARDEKACLIVEDKPEQETPTDIRNDFSIEEAEPITKSDPVEDVSDMSDSIDHIPLRPDSEDRDSSPVNWDTDASEVHQPSDSRSGVNGVSTERTCPSVMDDSSSTCSTDSLPSVVMNGPYKGSSLPKQKNQKSPSRGRNQRGKAMQEAIGWATNNRPSDVGHANDASGSFNVYEAEEATVNSLQQHVDVAKKQEEDVSVHRKPTPKEEVNAETSAKVKTTEVPSSPRSPPRNPPSAAKMKSEPKFSAAYDTVIAAGKSALQSPQKTDKTVVPKNSSETIVVLKAYAHKTATPKPTEKPIVHQVPSLTEKPMAHQVPSPNEKPMAHQVPSLTEKPMAHQIPSLNEKPMAQQVPASDEKPKAQVSSVTTEKPIAQQILVATEKPTAQQVMSRPLSAPLIPGPQPPALVVSMVRSAPSLSRSASATGRLGPDPSPATTSYAAQSYRNAVTGDHVIANSSGYTKPHSPNATSSSLHSYSQPPALISAPIYLPQNSERMDRNSIRPPNLLFGMTSCEVLQNGSQWIESAQRDSSRSINSDHSMLSEMQNRAQWMDNAQRERSLRNDMQNFDMYKCLQSRYQGHFPVEFPAGTSGRHPHSVLGDEFPHLDIINDLLDDEQGIGKSASASSGIQTLSNGPHHLNRQFTFTGDVGMSGDMVSSSSSCRFERTRSYQDDGFHHNYHPGVQFDSSLIPQANIQMFPNGQMEGLIPNLWQMTTSDLSNLRMMGSENEDFSYHIPEYSNLPCGVDGYTVFRTSN